MKPTAFFLVTAGLLALPHMAQAQATRTWVSGVGDDANPCSRTAPCKTFAGAISKTAAGGEIDALDPGGFGTLTITKALTIDGGPGVTSILASGTPGVTVNAGATDRVELRNLSITGVSQSTTPGTTGVNFIAGDGLTLDHVVIQNFSGYCVNFQPAAGKAKLVVVRSILENCSLGGVVASTAATTANRANISTTSIVRNGGPAVTAGAYSDVSISDSLLNNNAGGGLLAQDANASVQVSNSNISNNQVFGVRSTAGTISLAQTQVTLNNGPGLSPVSPGLITTWSNNWVNGNTTNGAPSSTMAPQ